MFSIILVLVIFIFALLYGKDFLPHTMMLIFSPLIIMIAISAKIYKYHQKKKSKYYSTEQE